MAYKKKWTYKKRRYYRRKKLTKRNIFGNKSSKGQAKQIYALNKKINRIEKQTKPETLIYQNTEWMTKTIDCRGVNGKVIDTDFDFLFTTLENAVNPFNWNGKLCRVNDLWLYFNMSIARSAQNNYDALPQDAYIRITIQKFPKQMDRGEGQITSLHTNYDGTAGAIYRVKGPLCPGCTAQGKIMYDHTFRLNDFCTKKLVKVHFKNIILRNENKVDFFDANEFFIMYTLYNASGSNDQQSPAVVNLSAGVKLAYYDEAVVAQPDDNAKSLSPTVMVNKKFVTSYKQKI